MHTIAKLKCPDIPRISNALRSIPFITLQLINPLFPFPILYLYPFLNVTTCLAVAIQYFHIISNAVDLFKRLELEIICDFCLLKIINEIKVVINKSTVATVLNVN